MKQFLQFPLSLKKIGDASISGHAAVFGNVDRQHDVLEPGAFREIVTNEEGRIPLLWQHRAAEPIGVAKVWEDAKGLAFDAELVLDDPKAVAARAHAKAGSVRGVSIGYDILPNGSEMTNTGIRRLTSVRLYEISLVTWAANPLARVEVVKAADECMNISEWEDALRSHGVSKRKARKLALATWPILRETESDIESAVSRSLELHSAVHQLTKG